MDGFSAAVLPQITDVGIKILGAIILWFVGRWVIGIIQGMVAKALEKNAMDATLKKWLGSIVSIALNIFLVIAILNVFGIETTSFAALIAAAGLAIGAAWSGLLANFAAGVFLILFKPFKVGDFVTAGDVTGVVTEIGMFATTINTPDNVKTIVGNGAISGGKIQNFTANAYRAVDLRAQLNHSVDPAEAMAKLAPAIAAIPNVLSDPAPLLSIGEFTEFGPKLIVRPFCHNDHYWQVLFDANKAMGEVFTAAGYPVPSHYQTEYAYDMGAKP
jgi:small conductance mechanosensitive channel